MANNKTTTPSPSTEQWAAYQNLYTHLNNELWDGRLPDALLNFSRHNGAAGFFVPDTWRGHGSRKTLPEISVNPDHLTRRELKATVSTLAHEMVHLWQAAFGKPSRLTYHNKEWSIEMERIGLTPSSTGEPGGKKTGQKMTHYITPGGAFERAFAKLDPESILPYRAVHLPQKEAQRRAKQKLKYTCPACGMNVWGKPELIVLCGGCSVSNGDHVQLVSDPLDDDEG